MMQMTNDLRFFYATLRHAAVYVLGLPLESKG